MGSQRISNPWGEEGAQQLHLLRSNLIVDCRSRRSRLAFKRFHPEYCNLCANPSIPAILSTFVPNCPLLGVILSTFGCHFVHLWASFCPPLCSLRPFCPTPLHPLMMLPSSIASGFYPDIGSRSRPILHRLPSLLSFVRPPSSSLLLSNPRSCFREHSLPISSYAYSGLSLPKMAYSCK